MSLLYPMIHESNNEAASAVLAIVGGGGDSRASRARRACATTRQASAGGHSRRPRRPTRRASCSMLEGAHPRTLLRLRALADVDDRAGTELGHPAGRAAALAGLLQDRRSSPNEGLFNEVARLERGSITFTSRSSPTATRRWPTASRRSRASPRGCSRTRHERAVSTASGPRPRRPTGLLVLHHGRGTDERDLLRLADVLDPAAAARGLPARAAHARRVAGYHWYLRAARRLPRSRRPSRAAFGAARGAPRRAVAADRARARAHRARRLLDGRA